MWLAASQFGTLVVLGETIPDWGHAAGRRNEVDAVRHLIVTATGWGLNPDKDAIYLNVTPSRNDGATVYRLNVKDVPVDGFWSISLYDAEGYFVKNAFDAYTLNNITAKKSADGSVAVQFGDRSTPHGQAALGSRPLRPAGCQHAGAPTALGICQVVWPMRADEAR